MLPDIEPSDALTAIKNGLDGVSEQGSAEIVRQLAGVATATTSPLAGALLPVVVVGLSQDKAVEIGAHVDQKLEQAIKNLDETDQKQAVLIHALQGFSAFLPDGHQWREAAIQSANGDPEMLVELLEEYQMNSDKRQAYEEAVTKVLTGDISKETEDDENFVEFLRDRFNVDTQDQALSMFLDIRDIMRSREVHEVLENSYNIKSDVESVREELSDTKKQLKAKIDSVLEAGLEDEGFIRINPLYLRTNTPENPKYCWRTGFELEDIRAGYAADRVIEDEKTVSEWLVRQLRDGDDYVVKGPPGVGKSTLCKQVAIKWFERQIGTVFYRQSNRKRFTRQGILSDRIENAEGHVLVIVEDAIRDESREILSTLKQFQEDNSVTFLLDSREQEWHEYDRKISDPRLLEIKNNKIDYYSIPSLSEEECVAIVNHFEEITGESVEDEPSSLLNEVQTETGAGEILHLSYHLSFYATDLLSSEDSTQITTFEKKIENIIEDLRSGEENKLALRLGVLINLLNGTDFDVRPEYLHALAENEKDHEDIGNLLDVMNGRLIFKGEGIPAHEVVEPFRANHEFWSVLYLKKTIDVFGKREASRVFGDSVSALFSLVDDPEKRERIEYYFQQEMSQLSEIEQDPNKWANKFIEAIFELGRRRPMLAPLFGRTKYTQIELPKYALPDVKARTAMWRGIMHYNGANIELAREELNRARDIVEKSEEISSTTGQYIQARCLCYLGASNLRYRGRDFDTAKAHLIQSKTLFENIEDELENEFNIGLGFVLINLGRFNRRKGSFEKAREYLTTAIELFDEKSSIRWKTIAMNHLGLVERDCGNLSGGREVLKEAIELSQDIEDTKYQARCLNSLGEVEENAGEFDKAETHYKRGLKLMQKVGDKQGKEYVYHNLGKISLVHDKFEDAKEHFRKSLELTKEIGQTRGEGISYIYLGRVARAQNQFDKAERLLERANELVQEVGGGRNRRVAETLYVRGLVARDQGQLDYAETLLNDALEIAADIGDKKTEAEIYSELGNLELKRGQTEDARKFLNWSLSTEDEVGNRQNIAHARGNLGISALKTGNTDQACRHLGRSRKIMVEIGSHRGIAYADLHLGRASFQKKDHESAVTKIQNALETFESTTDQRRCAKCHLWLGRVAHDRQNHNQAKKQLHTGLTLSRMVEDQYHLAEAEVAFANLLADLGDLEEAVDHLLRGCERFQDIGSPVKVGDEISKILFLAKDRGEDAVMGSLPQEFGGCDKHT